MTATPDLEARHAWRGALVAAALNAVGMPFDYFLARNVPNMPLYPSALSALVSVGLIVLLLIRRRRATVCLGSTVFLLNVLVILVALWITSGFWASTHAWTPFQANKLGILAVPLVAPDLRAGLVSIAGLAGTAIAKFYVLDPEIQRRLPVGEPWFVLIFAIFGGVLLVYRLRGLAFERDVLRLQAEAAVAAQVARGFLRLRDYANTPIQTIVFATALLRKRNPDLEPILACIDRAATRLMELSRALRSYDAMNSWSPSDQSSDAAALTNQAAHTEPGRNRAA
jgi:hypothetical protein